jgi:hypothetical protein
MKHVIFPRVLVYITRVSPTLLEAGYNGLKIPLINIG